MSGHSPAPEDPEGWARQLPTSPFQPQELLDSMRFHVFHQFLEPWRLPGNFSPLECEAKSFPNTSNNHRVPHHWFFPTFATSLRTHPASSALNLEKVGDWLEFSSQKVGLDLGMGMTVPGGVYGKTLEWESPSLEVEIGAVVGLDLIIQEDFLDLTNSTIP